MDYPDLSDPIGGIPTADLENLWAEVRGYCGWHIAPQVTETFVIDGSGSSIFIPTLRLVSVTALTVDGVVLTSEQLSGLDWSASGIITGQRTSRRPRSVTATVTHGYESCPGDLVAILSRLHEVGNFAGMKSAATLSVSFTVDSSSGTAGVDTYSAGVLDRYRLVDIA